MSRDTTLSEEQSLVELGLYKDTCICFKRGLVRKAIHASTKIEVPDCFAGTYAIKVIHLFGFVIDAPVENNPS